MRSEKSRQSTWPRRCRITTAVWFLLGFVLWLGIFDLYVDFGVEEYLRRQAISELGTGPRVTIDGIMDAAIARGVRAASLWAGIITTAGLISARVGVPERNSS